MSLQMGASRLLNYRSPAQILDLEQSTKAQHESRHGADQVLRDWHCDQNEDSELAIRDLACRCSSIVFSVHEFGEVVSPLPNTGFEREIYFSRDGENVAEFIVLPKKISIRFGGMVTAVRTSSLRQDTSKDECNGISQLPSWKGFCYPFERRHSPNRCRYVASRSVGGYD